MTELRDKGGNQILASQDKNREICYDPTQRPGPARSPRN